MGTDIYFRLDLCPANPFILHQQPSYIYYYCIKYISGLQKMENIHIGLHLIDFHSHFMKVIINQSFRCVKIFMKINNKDNCKITETQ